MRDRIDEERLATCGESAIDLAISNVKAGGLPFSAVIVNQNGDVVGKGVNQVAEHLDCTAHAEIQAIRDASWNEKSVSLKGTTLIASGEPCALCYMAIRMAGIANVRILLDRYEAAENGFDYLWTYQHLNPALIDELDVVTLDSDRKLLPFQMTRMGVSD
ncbi:tRNA-specific adenosine deaminase [Marinobacter sp. EhC06]|jgi:tRNA(Arg) A34 adenosine deaminase TadA|uniref:nucleoside deaminase n=1 Tax=Marinobacter TaxID=2742 RepID=UPI0007D8DF61|nr:MULTISPECIES: nucleoside deaminase [unclassified Marinobacter]OAN89181.1 tRNA-specific adenosine deaminase [Marinobacter sp. EhC06]OAN95823.1 tRNA-specific adenosine deaminase [Marinobacter sp. EhN04]